MTRTKVKGGGYMPQYISAEEYGAIVGSARETCASP